MNSNRFIRSGLTLGVALTGAIAFGSLGKLPAPQWAPDVYGGYASDHVIAKVKRGLNPVIGQNTFSFGNAAVDQQLRNAKAKAVEKAYPLAFRDPVLAAALGMDRYYTIRLPKGTNTPKLARELSRYHGVFDHVEIDGIGGVAQTFPNDPSFNVEWGLHNTGQSIPNSGAGTPDADIDAPEAWALATGGNNRILAVIDSGVNVNHPELAGKTVPGWNSVLNNTDVTDNCNHGTHVAGTAGAHTNNSLGVAGVSWGVQIMPIKVLTGCGGTEQQCGNGIIWAADHGANIGTMSLQYYSGSTYFRDCVNYAYGKGVLLIAATGNSQGNNVAYPAKFPNCMGVGATTNKDAIASFSNWGAEVDVSAPGQDVYSLNNSNGYMYLSGTSMATPHTSGLASLIWSINPNLTHDNIAQILKNTTDDKGSSGWDQFFGWGRINAYKAVLATLATLGTDLVSFQVLIGQHIGGVLDDAKNSDDMRMAFLSGPGILVNEPNTLVVAYSAKTSIQSPTTVGVTLEHRETLTAGGGRIQLFNYQTNAFDTVATFGLVTTDTVVTVSGLSASKYVNGSGNLSARIVTYTNASLAPYGTEIDQLKFTVN